MEKAGDAKISVEAWNDLSSEEQAEYEKKDFKYIDVDVSVDEYPDAAMHTTRYQKIVDKTEELPKNEKEASKFTYKEIQQRWVNVLDEHGQLQWEDSEYTSQRMGPKPMKRTRCTSRRSSGARTIVARELRAFAFNNT